MAHAYLHMDCVRCGSPMQLRHRKADGRPFLGCTGYPDCTFIAQYDEVFSAAIREMEDIYEAKLRQMYRHYLAQGPAKSPHPPQDTEKLFKKLLSACHPDKWSDNPVATELTKLLLTLRKEMP